MNHKCTKIAVFWIHRIIPWKWSSHRYIIRYIQKDYSAVVIRVIPWIISSSFVRNSRSTLHKFVRVDIQLMCHLICRLVVVVHLGINIVITSFPYVNGPFPVNKPVWFVPHLPVVYCTSGNWRETNAYLEVRDVQEKLTSSANCLFKNVQIFLTLKYKICVFSFMCW